MREQFTFYKEYFDEIQRFKRSSDRLRLYEAISDYSIYGKLLANLPNRLNRVFYALRQRMDADARSAYEIRHSREYKEWRSKVYERDKYTCQCCGAHGCKLNAHHIKPFAFFPKYRLEIDNGITLCESCHKAIHRKEG